MMKNEDIKKIANEILFSKEAADYLGISTQRLNQLVHSGQIKPIKQSSSGTLFFKADLDARKQDVTDIGVDMKPQNNFKTLDLKSSFMLEAMNYFTIQRFYNFSDKKTDPVIKELSQKVDLTLNIQDIYKDVSSFLKVSESELKKNYAIVEKGFSQLYCDDLILKKGTLDYPELLGRTKEAPQYLFLRGNIELLTQKIVSVVGSRQASESGGKRAYMLSKMLGGYGIVVASGLAKGIDTAAHTASIENGFKTITVLGTPITKAYPKENERLQAQIAEKGLIISQFPPSTPVQRWHFPMRNAVMSGISLATAVIEASETSGALKQADYALKQERLVFIPQSALDNPNILWPNKYLQRPGAHKFAKIQELIQKLEETKIMSYDSNLLSLFTEGVGTDYVR